MWIARTSYAGIRRHPCFVQYSRDPRTPGRNRVSEVLVQTLKYGRLCARSPGLRNAPQQSSVPLPLKYRPRLLISRVEFQGSTAGMARPIKRVCAEPDIVKELQRRSRSATIGVRDRERATIVLLRLEGVGVEDVAEQLKTTPKRVSVWARRFEISGLNGLGDKPGRGRKASIPAAKVARVVTEATRPPKGRRRWSIRTMSRHVGISSSSVGNPPIFRGSQK
jgi:transposase